jgi:hypothetical protein
MAEVVVANAGPLMALAKLNLLYLLKLLYGRVQFTRSVHSEVVIEGIRQGFEDAHTLKQFLHQEGWEPTTRSAGARNLGGPHPGLSL